jgi:hypothetical protein
MLTASPCVRAPVTPAAIPPAVQAARGEVEQAVVERFGAAALERARGADEFVAVLRYPGLPMPDHDTDGRPIKPSYPTALLYRENGRWFAFGVGGAHPVLPRWSQPLEALLRDPGCWPNLLMAACWDAPTRARAMPCCGFRQGPSMRGSAIAADRP